MRRAPAIACLFTIACTASGRCDPSPSFSVRPPVDASARGTPTIGCSGCIALRVSAGARHTCAVLYDEQLVEDTYCFGSNEAAQLGGEVPIAARSFVPRALTGFSGNIAAGAIHSCVIAPQGPTRGSLVCFGTNVSAILGLDAEHTFDDRSFVRESDAPMIVSLGSAHVVLVIGNDVIGWGDDHFGQLAAADREYEPERASISSFAFDADAGSTATCIADGGGTISCLGVFALEGQTLSSDEPRPRSATLAFDELAPVPGIPSTRFDAVSVGMGHGCGITRGEVWCFGSDLAGESGEGPRVGGVPGGARLVELPGPALRVSAGGAHDVDLESPLRFTLTPIARGHTCALVGTLESAELYCWGANDRGQLGDGTREDGPTPRRVPIAFPTRVSAGGAHTCATDRDGTLWCWGDNTYGQLGIDPDRVPWSDFPIAVDASSPIWE